MITFFLVILISGCAHRADVRIDQLNELSYAFHYRNLDSTEFYARKSLRLSDSLGVDGTEALNNLAFVCLARMQYAKAATLLRKVLTQTNNQVELLVADIQMMRLCQRQSRNKDFYIYRESAMRRLRRIDDESDQLSPHYAKRLIYARSEFSIVASTYFYYVGLIQESVNALAEIDPNGSIQQDMAQQLSYWYNVGAGGIVKAHNKKDVAQKEFDYLMRCYLLSREYDYPYWEAQAMQGMSEHLQNPRMRAMLIRDNLPAMKYINIDRMPDSLLAGNLAQRAHDMLLAYGDVYQIAGANRTLAECFWHIKDYQSALACLRRALESDTAINQAPDLVASIREQLSLVYSAVDDKVNSDRNRNLYLDMQEQTRQDRQLEARAAQLDKSSSQLNMMLAAVIFMIILVSVLLVAFDVMRRRGDARFSLDTLLEPLTQWRKRNETRVARVNDQYDRLREQTYILSQHLRQNKRLNIEQRAKIQLVNTVTPLIDRMKNEVNRLKTRNDSPYVRQQRYQYIAELTDSINDYNDVLTQWIQMRQGEIGLKIESFELQSLFDIVSHGDMNFKMKGIDLEVEPTDSVVKADKTLTLFMINTIADNARKYTPEGGKVRVSSVETDDYVEISVEDNGRGMAEDQLGHIFDRTYTGGHGFGLKNCNGIIEKYKKISRIFKVCAIYAESEVGRGSRLAFRLPKGVVRRALTLLLLAGAHWGAAQIMAQPKGNPYRATSAMTSAERITAARDANMKAARFADSAYFSNIKGTYAETMRYADSCHHYLEPTDTALILDISNETAVAALALHQWDVYQKNNRIYTQLFREASADDLLPAYVRNMQKSETNKNVAIILLLSLLAVIFPAYYFLYYRFRLNYRFCIDRVNAMNQLLLSDMPDTEKLHGIERLNDFKKYSISIEQQENIDAIVNRIRQALRLSIDETSKRETSMEWAEDNLRRLEMDNDRLHVSNSVLDNCLSTLKHETMYYPARIRHLVNGTDDNLHGIEQLVNYYHELYHILSLQAVNQITPLRIDADVTDFLFELLRDANHGEMPMVSQYEANEKYVVMDARMSLLRLDANQCHGLFTPNTIDLKFLVCQQIVREMGEQTNLRRCGINPSLTPQGCVKLAIVMPKRFAPAPTKIAVMTNTDNKQD